MKSLLATNNYGLNKYGETSCLLLTILFVLTSCSVNKKNFKSENSLILKKVKEINLMAERRQSLLYVSPFSMEHSQRTWCQINSYDSLICKELLDVLSYSQIVDYDLIELLDKEYFRILLSDNQKVRIISSPESITSVNNESYFRLFHSRIEDTDITTNELNLESLNLKTYISVQHLFYLDGNKYLALGKPTNCPKCGNIKAIIIEFYEKTYKAELIIDYSESKSKEMCLIFDSIKKELKAYYCKSKIDDFYQNQETVIDTNNLEKTYYYNNGRFDTLE